MSHLQATQDQIKISNDLEQQMLNSQNPKFRMDETAYGTEYNLSAAGFQTENAYARN